METADRLVAVATAGLTPAADITLTAGIVLDRGRTAGGGRTGTGEWLTGGTTRRTDGLDDIPLYVSKNITFNWKRTVGFNTPLNTHTHRSFQRQLTRPRVPLQLRNHWMIQMYILEWST